MQITTSKIGNTIKATVISPPCSDCYEYAFTLYHNGDKKDTAWYTRNMTIYFDCPLTPGEYFVRCFRKDLTDNTKIVKNSKRAYHSPLIIMKGEKEIATGRYANLSYFGSIIKGDYETQKKHGFIARTGAEGYPLSLPLKYYGLNDRNLEFALNAWKYLSPHWKAFFESKRIAYFNEIVCYVNDWYEAVYEKKQKIKFVWYDMAAGLRAINLALIIRVLKNEKIELSEKFRIALNKLIETHFDYLENEKNINLNNHGIWQILGLRLLSQSLGDTVPSRLTYCSEQVHKLLLHNFSSDNVNTENSPYYHKYTVDLLRWLPPELFPEARQRILEISEMGNEISAWLTGPDGDFFLIGDSSNKGVAFPHHDIPIDATIDNISYISKLYPDAGYAIVRTHPAEETERSTALIFHASSVSHSHGHSDKLSFLYFHNGIEVFTDSGKYSYEHDKERQYFISDKAHNTVGLATRSFLPAETSLGASEILTSSFRNGSYTLSGSTRKNSLEFSHDRVLNFSPGKFIKITDKLRLKDENADQIELRFHFGKEISIIQTGRFVFSINYQGKSIGKLSVLTPFEYVQIVTGSSEPFVGWSSRKYRVKFPIPTMLIRFPPSTRTIESRIDFVSPSKKTGLLKQIIRSIFRN